LSISVSISVAVRTVTPRAASTNAPGESNVISVRAFAWAGAGMSGDVSPAP